MACWALLLLAPSFCTDAQGPLAPDDGTPPSTGPVATVAVSPSGATIRPGGAIQLSATLRDSAGNVLTDRAITWSSSNTDIGMVSSSGVVTGVTEGSTTITATSEGRAGTASIVVSTAAATYPNEPAGFTRWAEHDFSCAPGTAGCSLVYGYAGKDNWGSELLTIVDDLSAPAGGDKVLRVQFKEGWPSGLSPPRFWLWDQPSQAAATRLEEWYTSLWIKLEGPDWEMPPNEQKLWYERWANLEGSTRATTTLRNMTFPEPRELVGEFQMVATTRPCNDCVTVPRFQNKTDEHVFTVGQWHHIEVYRKLSDPGVANGVLRIWVDDALVSEHTALQYLASDESGGFAVWMWSPVWGGKCTPDCPRTRDDFMRLAHLYVSGKP